VSLELRFRPQIVDDVAEAVHWYEDRCDGLGSEFLSAFDAALRFIRHNPEACRRMHGRFRRALLHRFPYAVYYAVEAEAIVITLVTHCARDPAWMRNQLAGRSGGDR
jgi:plasmid stabilization system protein ParE